MKVQRFSIGIDIGGTNTDAVLVNDQQTIIASVKVTTTREISQGFKTAVASLLKQAAVHPSAVQGVFLGTTHAINAILQRQGLYRVGVIRLAGHQPQTLPSCYQWPKELKQAVLAGARTIDGGFECDGRAIKDLKPDQIANAIEELRKLGAESLAIIGVFSPLSREQEIGVANYVKGEMPISLSCEIGGVGFIERENSTILNAALKKVMAQGFRSLQTACRDLGLNSPLFITQNDGSLMTLQQAIEYPVLTMSAGPTNSFRGGALLAKQTNAIVIDIGGTSTDVGLVSKGFPRRSLNTSLIGGVRLNFSMPDVLSIGLGGGSCISMEAEAFQIGPRSVARELMEKAKAFGGDQLTLTDAALVTGCLCIDQADPERSGLTRDQANRILSQAFAKVSELACAMRGGHDYLPMIIVGGGATLFSCVQMPDNCFLPSYFDVANAYGATLSEIAATIDTVVSLSQREATLESLKSQAVRQAIEQGADPDKVRLIDQHILPYPYLPNQMARVIIRAAGPQKKIKN
ncbi:ROK family protein [Candidatus Protochlamydia phocaeensis]|uniref:ROK family protein n=1 Tax=Candidatus Protochlamydia phocaeensis TaxID=1414722 RepID=UPI0008381308|nr:hydantoinase/oxoprolinase family protein [Candidatus Protochlamydia phocaeensis]